MTDYKVPTSGSRGEQAVWHGWAHDGYQTPPEGEQQQSEGQPVYKAKQGGQESDPKSRNRA